LIGPGIPGGARQATPEELATMPAAVTLDAELRNFWHGDRILRIEHTTRGQASRGPCSRAPPTRPKPGRVKIWFQVMA